MKPNFDLLRETLVMVEAVAALGQFNLDEVVAHAWSDEPTIECGAVCCVMGLCALTPKFQDRFDISYHWELGLLRNGQTMSFQKMGTFVFDLGHEQSYNLFGPTGISHYDVNLPDYRDDISLIDLHQSRHVDLYRHRLAQFFAEHGEVL